MLSDIGTTDVERVTGVFGLSSSERRRLLDLHERPTADWSWLARRRARTERYSVRATYLADIVSTSGVLASGISALDRDDMDLTARAGTAEIYSGDIGRQTLVREFALRADSAGNLIVHVVPAIDGLARLLEGRTEMTTSTVAIDLLELGETRARRAGLRLLDQALGRHSRE